MQQFCKNCKDGNDTGHLKVFMRLEIQFFLVIAFVYIFMWLVLQAVNPFMQGGNKRPKNVKQIYS